MDTYTTPHIPDEYTREDYVVGVREASGRLKVLSQRVTGDGSVAFQLSRCERRARQEYRSPMA